ncbi:aminotransferase class IV [Anabaena sp. FACHB-1237]|uniref:aminotransferase class IV n=1 Tax=Anabaena sp. FACHB-1237 TaxID=2692769 RepID=UPI00168106C5|nr:aminotransferase class IV [Anabaena sp. FACHB-1237]MBD2138839.1 aminotransferase class IV [Anabaena sp. FACHB-1237]
MLWINGILYKETVVPFDLRDRGLLLGDGLFETIAIFNHTPFQLQAHLQRLEQGCNLLRIPINSDRINQAITTIIPQLTNPHGILRITVTRGIGERGLLPSLSTPKPTIIATVNNWQPLNYEPIKLFLSTIKRNENSPLSRIKSLCYLDQIMALQEAVEAGYSDAVMLNTSNKVVCSTSANIFCLYNTRLVTSPVSDGVLPGIMRHLILQDAESMGFQAEERSLTWDELLAADIVLLTNSVKLVRHVTTINLQNWHNKRDYRINIIRNHILNKINLECGTDLLNQLQI